MAPHGCMLRTDRGRPESLLEREGTHGAVPHHPALIDHRPCRPLAERHIHLRAAFETSKLSSSIW
jgi:hypothetical protein